MSERSYAENVRKRVTGPSSSTCLMAAYDRITDRLGISTATYVQYERTRREFERVVGDGRNYVPPEIVRSFSDVKQRFRAELLGSIQKETSLPIMHNHAPNSEEHWVILRSVDLGPQYI
jgi:hypothetical protein